ncbi:hypothetical protein TIFTF001_030066 [Ficus carica]|uniref:Disease resistance N-terminal domain-containing protein n=1 Tax=Ficus carica TaxID=3494 RepID=A0AA88DSQ7_FICCA|nr:hypothetical protein TIFTF001_030066 [Ficus carica]
MLEKRRRELRLMLRPKCDSFSFEAQVSKKTQETHPLQDSPAAPTRRALHKNSTTEEIPEANLPPLLSGKLLYVRKQVQNSRQREMYSKDQERNKRLKIVLNSVSAVIDVAEQKQMKSRRVETWLDELQKAVFDAEDLLDRIESHAFQLKLGSCFVPATARPMTFDRKPPESFTAAPIPPMLATADHPPLAGIWV